jgi:hypothetical protein
MFSGSCWSCLPSHSRTSDAIKRINTVASGVAELRPPDVPTCALRGAARHVGHNGWRHRSAGAIVHWSLGWTEMQMHSGDQTYRGLPR